MAKIVLISDIYVSNLTSSGILISDNLYATITTSYIAHCSAELGGGISIEAGALFVHKTCIYGCYASLQGSAIYSYTESHINLSSVCRCADKKYGSDDSINLELSIEEIINLNTSYSYSSQASSIQLSACTQMNAKNNIYAHGFGAYVFQHNLPQSNGYHYYDIFINNTVTECTIAFFVPKPIYMKGCVFKNNQSPVLFEAKNGATMPSITFNSVVIMDSCPIGTYISYTTSTGKISVPGPKEETAICRMFVEQCSFLLKRTLLSIAQVLEFLMLSAGE